MQRASDSWSFYDPAAPAANGVYWIALSAEDTADAIEPVRVQILSGITLDHINRISSEKPIIGVFADVKSFRPWALLNGGRDRSGRPNRYVFAIGERKPFPFTSIKESIRNAYALMNQLFPNLHVALTWNTDLPRPDISMSDSSDRFGGILDIFDDPPPGDYKGCVIIDATVKPPIISNTLLKVVESKNEFPHPTNPEIPQISPSFTQDLDGDTLKNAYAITALCGLILVAQIIAISVIFSNQSSLHARINETQLELSKKVQEVRDASKSSSDEAVDKISARITTESNITSSNQRDRTRTELNSIQESIKGIKERLAAVDVALAEQKSTSTSSTTEMQTIKKIVERINENVDGLKERLREDKSGRSDPLTEKPKATHKSSDKSETLTPGTDQGKAGGKTNKDPELKKNQ